MRTTYGEITLTDEYVKKISDEGATEQDFESWWLFTEQERSSLVVDEDYSRIAMFSHFLREGLTDEEASKGVRNTFPMYGDPSDTIHVQGEDRLLPHELRLKVNKHLESYVIAGSSKEFKKKKDTYSSYNAFIRKMIEIGEIESSFSSTSPN